MIECNDIPIYSTMGAPYDIDDTIRLGAPYDIDTTVLLTILAILFQQIISLVPKTVKIKY